MITTPPGWMTPVALHGQTLVLDLERRHLILSSAPRGGGILRARYVLNHQVPDKPVAGSNGRRSSCGDATRYLGRLAASLGIHVPCVGMMTAVRVEDVVLLRAHDQGCWIEALLTVGVSNAVRVGESVLDQAARRMEGTINIIVRTNARLSLSGMVGLIQVTTEAKAAALMSQDVRSQTGRPGATGTGTDATTIISGVSAPRLHYCGTHTKIGELVGQVVYDGVVEGLCRYGRRQQQPTAWSPGLSRPLRMP